jgi:site-specific DNA-methyltransferase (adenine-specific)
VAGAVKAYYSNDAVALYVGDMREVLPALDVTADLVLADPPYGETTLAWDRWPDGWLDVAATVSRSLWCFGSTSMFGERWREFGNVGWKLSQDVVWEKHNGSGFAADRFKRVHEAATHWYRTRWAGVYHETPRERGNPHKRTGTGGAANRTTHAGAIGVKAYVDDGTRLLRSVIRVRSMQNLGAIHPTEKPLGILDPLIRYACPPGGLVVDPFAGSGSTLDAARQSGRRAIGIERYEPYAEKAARRLEQMTLETS